MSIAMAAICCSSELVLQIRTPTCESFSQAWHNTGLKTTNTTQVEISILVTLAYISTVCMPAVPLKSRSFPCHASSGKCLEQSHYGAVMATFPLLSGGGCMDVRTGNAKYTLPLLLTKHPFSVDKSLSSL